MKCRRVAYADIPAKSPTAKRYGVISDVHLGHPRTPTWKIVETLNKYVTNTSFMSSINALFIPGDLFDRLLNMASVDVTFILEWTERLIRLARTCKTPVRILEGTPSHDWRQTKLIVTIKELYGNDADILFYDDLSIVEDEALGITIGYVPDKYRETCEQTTLEFKEMMATRGYQKLDFILMHGMFEFQVPDAVAKSLSHFKEHEWEEMVNSAIIIGHDHKHKHSGKIVVPGSWERLAHNEEHNKGGLVVDVDGDLVDVYHFTNEDATTYVTINGVNSTDIEVIELVEVELKKLSAQKEPMGRIKIKYNKEYDLSSKVAEWSSLFSELIIQTSRESLDEKPLVQQQDEFQLTNDTINITPENIIGMVLREAEELDSLTSTMENELKNIHSLTGV